MPRIDFSCNYCGCVFHEYVYSEDQVDGIKCIKCKDSNLKVFIRKDEETDAFGYNKDKKVKDAYIRSK